MAKKDNPSKEEIINSIMARDFSGDVREVFKTPESVQLKRLRPNVLRMTTLSGDRYCLVIKKEVWTPERKAAASRAAEKRFARTSSKPASAGAMETAKKPAQKRQRVTH